MFYCAALYFAQSSDVKLKRNSEHAFGFDRAFIFLWLSYPVYPQPRHTPEGLEVCLTALSCYFQSEQSMLFRTFFIQFTVYC